MKKALGKGLSALIPDSYIKDSKKEPVRSSSTFSEGVAAKGAFRLVPIAQIKPNRDQVRHEFDPEAIEELAASIKEKGVLQPIIVKRVDETQYEIICGERRHRAAKLCGLEEVPVIVKEIADTDFLEWALIENIQREDLNVIEEAEAYKRLAEERSLSQEAIAKKVGKNRTTVTNTLRLLQLPVEVRRLIEDNLLTSGHARALLGLMTPEHQRQLARRIIEEKLSVRQTEALVTQAQSKKRKPKKARDLTPEILDLEDRLAKHLGTQVKIFPRKNRNQGRIEIQYFSLDDLDRILERIRFSKE